MSWRNLRSISTDPLSNFLSKLAQDQIFRESQQESAISDNLEEDRFIGKTFYSICEIRAIKQPFATKIPVNTVFLTPEEPDLDRMRLWVKFDSGAYSQFDHSLFHNEVLNKGYMLPVAITSATYDEGIVGGKIALMYNNIDSLPKSAKAQFGGEVAYTRVTDNQNIRLSSYLNGTITGYDAFCISMLVRPMQLYLDTDINGIEGWNRRLCSKIDDSNLDYAYEIRIAQEGSLIIIFRRAGTDYLYYVSDMFEMSPGADFNPLDFREGDFRTIDPVTGVIYDTPKTNIDNHFVRLDVIYKFSDNSVIVRMDNQDQTVLPLDPSFATWPSNPTIHTKDLLINSGPFAGNFADRPLGIGINEWADFRIYVGELTSQESTNLYTNKYSISDIGFGKVALSGYTLQNNDTVHLPDITKDIFGITKLFPTKDFGSEWFSAAWNNGISRIIQNPPQECSSDPYDNQLSVSRAGDPRVTIQGNGIMKLDASTGLTGSPRVVILSNTGWKNVESTVYMRCPTIAISGMDVTIRAKTEHYCVNHPTGGDDDDLFGGYNFTTDYTNQRVNLRRERSHNIGYSDRQAIVGQTLPANTWLGFKCILYNLPDGNVKLEYYKDVTDGLNGGTWIKVTEKIDNGTWGGAGGGQPIFTDYMAGSAIRTDIGVNAGFLELKRWSIREIEHPNAISEDDE